MVRAARRLLLEVESWVITVALVLRGLLYGGRGTHTCGVGARGELRIDPDPALPQHAFFQAGRVLPLVARHATAFRKDDACKNVRSLSIRWDTQDPEERFNLIMNTGPLNGFWDGVTFLKGLVFFAFGAWGRKLYFQGSSVALRNIRGGSVRAPSSFSRLRYYGKIVFGYRDIEGMRYLARFRIVPFEEGPEDGVPTGEDAERPWNHARLPGEGRAKDYLRREFRERVSQGPVQYRLQIQLLPEEGAGEGAYNTAEEWGEDPPWRELGSIRLTSALSDEECERLRFWILDLPPSIDVPRAHSITDYRALGHLRGRVYPRAQFVRGLLGR